jgi:flagellar basal body-associated protein FliL
MQHTARTRRLIELATSDTAVGAWIAASLVAVASVLGTYASMTRSQGDDGPRIERPRPVWMPLKPVRAQMSDGNMLAIKVSLQLSKTKNADELTDYSGVFGSLVEQAGQHTSRRQLREEDGLERFSIQIQRDLNDYLDEHDTSPTRVTSVLFDELVQLPN